MTRKLVRFSYENCIKGIDVLDKRSGLYVSLSGGKTSTLSITSLTNFASFGNRGKDSNRASQHGQCQR
jgi:hypothetical protein